MRLPLLLFTLALAALAQDQTGAIRGMVVDSVTHQPVRKAVVLLQHIGTPPRTTSAAAQPSSTRPANSLPVKPPRLVTDASGIFMADQLAPGLYQVTITHPNYPQGRFGATSAAKSFTVTAGATAGPVTVELIPGASISGRILDEDGDPLDGCSVQLHPAKLPEQGVMGGGGGNLSRALEAGEYRLFGVMPGKYVVTAQCLAPVFQPRPLSAGPDPPPAFGYPRLFYPGADTVEGSEAIELSAGLERPGIDFRMTPVAVTQIHVTLAGNDWRGRKDLTWRLTPLDQIGIIMGGGNRQIDTSKDAFDVTRVFPGSYMLIVSSTPGRDANPTLGAFERVDVKDRPVPLTLELRHSIDISGTVEIESGGAGSPLSLNQIRVQLVPENPGLRPFAGGQNGVANVQDDGTFTLRSVFPAPAHLTVFGPSVFIKTTWFGSTNVTGGAVDLASGATGELRILVSTNVAAVHGTAPPGSEVWATMADGTSPGGTHRTQADENGQFKIDGLAPGRYRVATTAQPGATPEEGGQEITLQEGETRTLEFKAE